MGQNEYGESGHLSIFFLKHLMMLLKYKFFRASFYTLPKTLIACRAVQLRFFLMKTLLNNAFNHSLWWIKDFFLLGGGGGGGARCRRFRANLEKSLGKEGGGDSDILFKVHNFFDSYIIGVASAYTTNLCGDKTHLPGGGGVRAPPPPPRSANDIDIIPA